MSTHPFKVGRSAAIAGRSKDTNPYRQDSDAHWQWMRGWHVGARQVKKFNEEETGK